MKQDARQFILLSQAGCLLPGLLLFNFVFGWLFLKPLIWIAVELVLLLLFMVNSVVTARKVMSVVSSKDDSVIDVEAQVVDDERAHTRITERKE